MTPDCPSVTGVLPAPVTADITVDGKPLTVDGEAVTQTTHPLGEAITGVWCDHA